LNRRKFINTAASSCVLLGIDDALMIPAGARAGTQIGLQLYTVIDALERDFEGTLRAIAKIGYREVETMGSFGRDPFYVRSVLDKCGLTSPSQHVVSNDLYDIVQRAARGQLAGPDARRLLSETMTTHQIAQSIDEGISLAKILGQKNVVLPAIWPQQVHNDSAVAQLSGALNGAGDACAKAGLIFGIHNHGEELLTVNGRVPYDAVLEDTNPATVKLEMDVYWMIWAKRRPVEYLQRYAGRYTQVHLKDAKSDGEFSVMGKGSIDFLPILAAARKARVEHYYVEQNSAKDPIRAVRDSYAYLKSRL